jgi:hypothetical protein
MGINGPGFTEKPGYSVGGANDTYLLSVANNHYMGSATSGKITIFTGPDFNGEENAKIILRANNQHELTGSFKVSGSITGSLFGTASNAVSASYAVIATSASYAQTSSFASNFTVAGTLTAQTINVQTVSSSVIYSSGSNVFGNSLSNTQKFTGSVQVTGSLTVNNSSVILTNQTSSMSVLNAQTASYFGNGIITASVLYNTISFTKDNGSVFDITVLQSGSVDSASYARNADLLDGLDSLSFTLTSSFNSFTSSYYNNSASFSSSISQLQNFSSSLDNTFATDVELNAATASLSASINILSSSYLTSSASFNTRILANSSSIGILSSSFTSFSGSYNTGSFTGSFIGDGSGLTNISASSVIGLNLSQIASGSVTASVSPVYGFIVNSNTSITGTLIVSNSVQITGSLSVNGVSSFNNSVTINGTNVDLINSSSLNLTGGSGIYVTEPGVISGSIVGIGNVTAFSGSVNSRLTALETLIDGGTY